MNPTTWQAITAASAILSPLIALVAAVVCLKISQQIAELKADIMTTLAREYVTKDDLQMVLSQQHQPQARKAAAHA